MDALQVPKVELLQSGVRIDGKEYPVSSAGGTTREVFFAGDFAVKRTLHQPEANRREYDLWQRVKGTPYARYFAEVVAISDDSQVLIQRRLHMRPGNHPTFDERLLIHGVVKAHNLADICAGLPDNCHAGEAPFNWLVTAEGPVIFDYAEKVGE